MIITDLTLLKDGKNRLLSLDIGEKTIGLAVSDLMWLVANPRTTISRKSMDLDVKNLLDHMKNENAVALVMGFPLNMNGTQGPSCKRVMDLVEALCRTQDIPVFLWDERLSTVAVTRTLLEADMSRKKRGQIVDKMAASFILQGVLNSLRF